MKHPSTFCVLFCPSVDTCILIQTDLNYKLSSTRIKEHALVIKIKQLHHIENMYVLLMIA